jgi:peptidoglycan/LPS O-acetylase OafA/YrhL
VRYSLQGIALRFIFIAVIRLQDTPYFRILNWRPMVFVGALSYSLYLLHYAVILGVRQELGTLHPVMQAGIALAISLALAWAIYLFVERPCADLRRRLQVNRQ